MFRCVDCKSGKTTDSRRNLLRRMVSGRKEVLNPLTNSPTSREPRHSVPRNATSHTVEARPTSDDIPSSFVTTISALLKRLDKTTVYGLESSVEWGNSGESECVPLQLDTRLTPESERDGRRSIRLGEKTGNHDPVHLVCKAWRWPQLSPSDRLHSLGFCRTGWCSSNGNQSITSVCINPFHWGIIAPEDTKINKDSKLEEILTRLQSSQCKRKDAEDSRSSSGDILQSLNTDSASLPLSVEPDPPWCLLSYWELFHHLRNSWIPVSTSTFNVFSALHTGDGLWLPGLQEPSKSLPDSSKLFPPCTRCCSTRTGSNNSSGEHFTSLDQCVCWNPLGRRLEPQKLGINSPADMKQIQRCRDKIGHGISLFREVVSSSQSLSPRLWVYNRSDQPIFISSPTLLPSDLWTLDGTPTRVIRLQPGHLLLAFDPLLFDALTALWQEGAPKNALPTRPGDSMNKRVVQISLGKGWGAHYRRQSVAACPCRLEIVLPPSGRQWQHDGTESGFQEWS